MKIIEALIFLHETAKIVHCALSPHSILFAKRSKKHCYFEVKIANFEYAIDMTCDLLEFLTYFIRKMKINIYIFVYNYSLLIFRNFVNYEKFYLHLVLAKQRHDLYRWLAPEIALSQDVKSAQSNQQPDVDQAGAALNPGRQTDGHIPNVAQPSTDFYSLCAMIAELFAGEEPWHELDDPIAILDALRAGHSLADRLVLKPRPPACQLKVPRTLEPHLKAGLQLAQVDRTNGTSLLELRAALLRLVNARVTFDNRPPQVRLSTSPPNCTEDPIKHAEPVTCNVRGGHCPTGSPQARISSPHRHYSDRGDTAQPHFSTPSREPTCSSGACGSVRFATSDPPQHCNQRGTSHATPLQVDTSVSEKIAFLPMEPVVPLTDRTKSGNESALLPDSLQLSPEGSSLVEPLAPVPASTLPLQRSVGTQASGSGLQVVAHCSRTKTPPQSQIVPTVSCTVSFVKEPHHRHHHSQVHPLSVPQRPSRVVPQWHHSGGPSFVMPKTTSSGIQVGPSLASLLDLSNSDPQNSPKHSLAMDPYNRSDMHEFQEPSSFHMEPTPSAQQEYSYGHHRQLDPSNFATMEPVPQATSRQEVPIHSKLHYADTISRESSRVVSVLTINPFPAFSVDPSGNGMTQRLGSNITSRSVRNNRTPSLQGDHMQMERAESPTTNELQQEIRRRRLQVAHLLQKRPMRSPSSTGIEDRLVRAAAGFPAPADGIGGSNARRHRSCSMKRPSPPAYARCDSVSSFAMKPATHFTDLERLPLTGISQVSSGKNYSFIQSGGCFRDILCMLLL